MSMSRFSFTKTAKHRKFDYQPLYYDKAKEEREQEMSIREAHLLDKQGISPISGFYDKGENRSAMRKASRYRKMMYLIVMFGLMYAVFGVGVNFYAEIACVIVLFILMVLFIREVNRY